MLSQRNKDFSYSPFNTLKKLWAYLSPSRKQQFIVLLLIMLFVSLSEILSISAVIPFLGALSSPEFLYSNTTLKPLFNFFNIYNPKDLLFPLTILFGLTSLIVALMRLFLLTSITKLAFSIGADFSNSIYKKTLYQKYEIHCSRNSSQVIDGVITKTNNIIFNVIIPTLKFISSFLILALILLAMIFFQPGITILTFGVFGLAYYVIIKLTRLKQLNDGNLVAKGTTALVKLVQEGMGGIRDILIDNNQEIYCKAYKSQDSLLRKAQGEYLVISQSPRIFMEAIGILIICFLAFFLTQKNNQVNEVFAILGVLALGAQRLLPLLQQIYISLSDIRFNYASLIEVVSLLEQPLPFHENLPKRSALTFTDKIVIKNLNFRFDAKLPYVINGVNLIIKKGHRIGIVGKTGSGKSTFLDIIMGLLDPTSGYLKIDNEVINVKNKRSWQVNIAHVPQNIFIADGTIEENIAFGIDKDKINHQAVINAAKQADIHDDIKMLPNKYQTLTGERGIRLSGGQKQRLGIARALYKQANIIIFDEATSSLDNKTEKSVMDAIDSLDNNLTLIIVAHRVSTLKRCNEIIEFDKGIIKFKGSYNKYIELNKDF
jgi:ABC-type multidrug transport system fused ATPase/permease subunit